MFNLRIDIDDLITEKVKASYTYTVYERSDIPDGHLDDFIGKNRKMLSRLLIDCLREGVGLDYYKSLNGEVLIDPYQMEETPEAISAVVEDMIQRIYFMDQYSIDQIIVMMSYNIKHARFYI